LFTAVIAIDVFLKSFIIVSTHRRRHVASENRIQAGFTESEFIFRLINGMHFVTESEFGFTVNPKPIIEYPLTVPRWRKYYYLRALLLL